MPNFFVKFFAIIDKARTKFIRSITEEGIDMTDMFNSQSYI